MVEVVNKFPLNERVGFTHKCSYPGDTRPNLNAHEMFMWRFGYPWIPYKRSDLVFCFCGLSRKYFFSNSEKFFLKCLSLNYFFSTTLSGFPKVICHFLKKNLQRYLAATVLVIANNTNIQIRQACLISN